MPPSAFPTAATIGVPKYNFYDKPDPDWDEITVETPYEDGGLDTNQSATAPPQRYIIKLEGLDETQAKVVMDHYASAKGKALTFSFAEPRNFPFTTTGSTITGVQYESYVHTRPFNIYDIHSFEITLIKRP